VAFISRRLVPFVATLGLLLALRALAQDPKPATIDPAARQLLDEVAKAYKALPGYSDQGEFSIDARGPNGPQKESEKRPFEFARPNKFDFDIPQMKARLVSDGKQMTTAIGDKYFAAPAPAHPSMKGNELRNNPVADVLFNPADARGLCTAVLMSLLTADEPVKAILEGAGGLKLEADRQFGGKAVKALLISRPEGPDMRLLVDPKTKLVQRIEFVFGAAELPPGVTVSMGWSAGTISAKAPSADAFTFKPGPDSTKVEKIADLRREESPMDSLVGNPSPDFTVTVLDGAGKTKKVSKQDLEGKVVLIDFWATWCGPCMMELPEIQKLVEAYDKGEHKDDLVVLAVSLDQDQEIPAVRKLVEETLVDKKIELTKGSVGRIALDPSNASGESFKVQGIPALVLLDGKGVVQQVHVGFSPDIREELTKEIDTLLKGESLVKAKGGEKAEASK
jgi:thiol-disulfide isomerase/thioredoxin